MANRLPKTLDMNVRDRWIIVLYIPFCHMESLYGDSVWRHSINEYLPYKKVW
jgi:hypothetical protein